MSDHIAQKFEKLQGVRNAFVLRILAWLTIAFFGGFWVLDWFIIPDHVMQSLALRITCVSYAIGLLFLVKFKRRWVQKHHFPLTLVLGLSLSWSIAVMSWWHQGFESPYYAGICMVVLAVAMVCSWNPRQSVLFYCSVYLFYVSPLVLGYMSFQNFPIALANQFFLVSLMILPAISQHHRVKMEEKDYQQRQVLKGYLIQVRHFATRDSLTELNNRRQMLLLGEQEYRRCERYQRPFSVILADIDHFKQVNDTYGHAVGDEVLQQVAEVLRKNSRNSDIVGRYGGEEFLIFLPEATIAQANTIVAERIQSSIRNKVFQTSAGPLKVSLSMGVCDNQTKSSVLQELIERADIALYEAKRSGRDQIIEWEDKSDMKRSQRRLG